MSFKFQAPEQDSIIIDPDSGWPVLETSEFRAHRRIPEQFEEQAIADSLNRSVLEVQQQLTRSAADKDVTFVLDANQVPQFSEPQISLYRQAVYSRSHADLLGYFVTVDHKDDRDNHAQQHNLLAQSNRTVRLLLGKGRCGVHSL